MVYATNLLINYGYASNPLPMKNISTFSTVYTNCTQLYTNFHKSLEIDGSFLHNFSDIFKIFSKNSKLFHGISEKNK